NAAPIRKIDKLLTNQCRLYQFKEITSERQCPVVPVGMARLARPRRHAPGHPVHVDWWTSYGSIPARPPRPPSCKILPPQDRGWVDTIAPRFRCKSSWTKGAAPLPDRQYWGPTLDVLRLLDVMFLCG